MLSGLSVGLWTKGLLVRFPVRGTCLGCGPVSSGGTREATTHWCFSPSLSPSLPLCLKINKILKKKIIMEMKNFYAEWHHSHCNIIHNILHVCGDAGVNKSTVLPVIEKHNIHNWTIQYVILSNDNTWLCYWFIYLLHYTFNHYFRLFFLLIS